LPGKEPFVLLLPGLRHDPTLSVFP
jgi:hypothetical protein